MLTEEVTAKTKIWFDQGCIELLKNKNYNNAIALFNHCVTQNPNISDYWLKLGISHFFKRNLKISENCFKKSLLIEPSNYLSAMNLGVINYETGDFIKANKYFKKSLSIKPEQNNSKIYMSLIHLTKKFSVRNIKIFEKFRNKEKERLIQSTLKISSLSSKSLKETKKNILLINSEGVGDHIMYSRYISKLKEYGHQITWLIDEKIKDIFLASPKLKKISIISKLNPRNSYDYLIDAISLPSILSKSKVLIPEHLKFNLEILKNKIPKDIQKNLKKPCKKIGFSWKGNPEMHRNSMRSIPLENLNKVFLSNKNTRFFALQKDITPEEKKIISKHNNVINCEKYLKRFSDTLVLTSKMDSIITICTSLVHIAGSLNIPTILMLSKVADWRWGLKKNNSLWYPKIKILRQHKIDDWSLVIKQLNNSLKKNVIPRKLP